MQIQDGQIHALINQKDGVVRLLEDPEQYKTSEMIEVMVSVIQRYVYEPNSLLTFFVTSILLCFRVPIISCICNVKLIENWII